MNIYSAWGLVPLFVVALCIAASSLFICADKSASFSSVTSRIPSLDGLRGFLALGVATHHGIIYYDYLLRGLWRAPPSPLFNQLGQASVGLFFITTAYLFWGKAIKATSATDFAKLLAGRVFRIAPVFCFLMLVAILSSLIATGFTIHESPETLLLEALRNLAFGVLSLTPFNGVNISRWFAGVTWTLVYEWYFYFLLPPLAFLARRIGRSIEVLVILLVVSSTISWMTRDRSVCLVTLFLWGILCADLTHRNRIPSFPNWFYSTVSLLAFLFAFTLFDGTFSGPLPAALLGLGFYGLVRGGDLFGLLSLKSAQRLGAISYDLYLVHGLIFTAAFAIPAVRMAAFLSPVAYWLVLIGLLSLALGAALVLHIFVELPGLALGRRMLASLKAIDDRRIDGRSRIVTVTDAQ